MQTTIGRVRIHLARDYGDLSTGVFQNFGERGTPYRHLDFQITGLGVLSFNWKVRNA